LGRVVKEIDGERGVTAYSYDAFGNQVAVERFAAVVDQNAGGIGSLANLETTLKAAAAGTAAATAAAMAAAVNVANVVAALDPTHARLINTTFDAINRKIQVQQPSVIYYAPTINSSAGVLGNAATAYRPTTLYTYDTFGNLSSTSTLISPQPSGTQFDPYTYSQNWNTTFFGYDKLRRQTDKLDDLNYYTQDQYDALGRLVDHIEYAGAQSLSFNAVHLPVFPGFRAGSLVTGALDRETAYSYDLLDRQRTRTQKNVQYETLTNGVPASTTGDLVYTTAYDALGNVIAITDPSGATTHTSYDALGHVTSVLSPQMASQHGDTSVSMRALGLNWSNPTAAAKPHTLDFEWSSLASWGSGDVVLTVSYYEYDYNTVDRTYEQSNTPNQVVVTLSNGLGDDGYTIVAGNTLVSGTNTYKLGYFGPGAVTQILVQKYVGTQLLTVYSYGNSGSTGAPQIEMGGIPANAAALQFQYQAINADGTLASWQTLATSKNSTFWLADMSALASGKYNYRLAATDSGGHAVSLSSSSADGSVSGVLDVGAAGGFLAPFVTATGVTTFTTPLTTYQYDLLGRRIAQTAYANGGTLDGNGNPVALAADAANDQVQYYNYDLEGRQIQAWDGNGKLQQQSYDTAGNLMRTWRQQTDVLGSASTQVTTYAYDRTGRQIETDQVVRSALSSNYTVDKTVLRFSAFGEQTGKGTAEAVYNASGTLQSGSATVSSFPEFAAYDDDGRVWQTDQGGVDTVYSYDLQGNATAKIVVPLQGFTNAQAQQGYLTAGGAAYDPTQPYTGSLLTDSSQVFSIVGGIETDTVYDALGHVAQQRDPAVVQDVPTANDGGPVSLAITSAAITSTGQSRYYDSHGEPYFIYSAIVAWPSLAGYGSVNAGNTRVQMVTDTGTVILGGPTTNAASGSISASGATLTWSDSTADAGTSVTSIEVDRLINGQWVSVRSSASTTLELTVAPAMGQTFNPASVQYTSSAGSGTLTLTAVSGASNVYDVSLAGLSGQISYSLSMNQPAAGITQTSTAVDAAPAKAQENYSGSFIVSGSTVTVGSGGGSTSVQPVRNQKADRWGNVTYVSDPRNAGWATLYGYDYANHRLYETTPAVDQWTATGSSPTTTSLSSTEWYDARGLKIASTDAAGHTTAWLYDADGHLSQTYNPDGGVVTDSWNALGQRTAHEDGRGDITTYGYDHNNQLLRQETLGVLDNLGNAVDPVLWYGYDESGNRISASDGMTDSSGNATELTRYRYDTLGRVVESLTPLAGTNAASPYKTDTAYDRWGNKIQETNGNASQNVQSWAYDAFGRLLSHSDLGGVIYTPQYDAWGRLARQSSSSVAQGGVHTGGENLSYAYTSNGWLKSVTETLAGIDTRTTLYRYDAAGHPILERYSDSLSGTLYQDSRITYDALGRVALVQDARFSAAIGYDAVGNRVQVNTSYIADPSQPNSGTVTTANYAYTYDAMNRVLSDSSGRAIAYDLGGMRRMVGSVAYDYDTLGRLRQSGAGTPGVINTYDQAGRLIDQQNYGPQYNNPYPTHVITGYTKLNERKYAYNQNSWLITENDYNADGSLNTRILYSGNSAANSDTPQVSTDAGYYDATGTAPTQYTAFISGSNTTNTYVNAYLAFDSYKQQSDTSTTNYVPPAGGGSYVPGNSAESYDVYGNLIQVSRNYGSTPNQSDIVDPSGHIRQQTLYNADSSVHGIQAYDYLDGNLIGTAGNLSISSFDPGYLQTAAQGTGSPTPQQYVVQQGDTLQGIAQSVYGDANLWYLLADANGLSQDGDLVQGQTLTIPNQVSNPYNSSHTTAPYDPSRIVGDLSAQPKYIAPPAPKCVVGSQVIGIIVAVVVTIISRNPIAGAAAGSQARQITFLSANGEFDWGKFFRGLATQPARNLVHGELTHLDPVDSAAKYSTNGLYSYGETQIAAAAAAATWGIGQGVSSEIADQTAQQAVLEGETEATGQALGQAAVQQSALSIAVASGIAGNVVQQLGDLAIGHQHSFSWASLAGAAVGTGATAGLNEEAGLHGFTQTVNGIPQVSYVAQAADSLLGGVAGNAVQVAINGHGHIELATIAVDAFGNYIANAVVHRGEVTDGDMQAATTANSVGATPAAGGGWDGISSGIDGSLLQQVDGPKTGGIRAVQGSDTLFQLGDGSYYDTSTGKTINMIPLPDSESPVDAVGGAGSGLAQDFNDLIHGIGPAIDRGAHALAQLPQAIGQWGGQALSDLFSFTPEGEQRFANRMSNIGPNLAQPILNDTNALLSSSQRYVNDWATGKYRDAGYTLTRNILGGPLTRDAVLTAGSVIFPELLPEEGVIAFTGEAAPALRPLATISDSERFSVPIFEANQRYAFVRSPGIGEAGANLEASSIRIVSDDPNFIASFDARTGNNNGFDPATYAKWVDGQPKLVVVEDKSGAVTPLTAFGEGSRGSAQLTRNINQLVDTINSADLPDFVKESLIDQAQNKTFSVELHVSDASTLPVSRLDFLREQGLSLDRIVVVPSVAPPPVPPFVSPFLPPLPSSQ